MLSQITYKKGWLRCKHGILLKRGKKVIGFCKQCPIIQIPVETGEASSKHWITVNEPLLKVYDQGVT